MNNLTDFLCPKCRTKLILAPGIGQYCPNPHCDVGDAPACYNDNGEQIAERFTYLSPKHPTLVKAVVIQGSGPDICLLTYDTIPGPIWPPSEPLHMKFEAAAGNGANYIREHFGVDAEVILEPSSVS